MFFTNGLCIVLVQAGDRLDKQVVSIVKGGNGAVPLEVECAEGPPGCFPPLVNVFIGGFFRQCTWQWVSRNPL